MGFFMSQMEVGLEITYPPGKAFVGGEALFDLLALLKNLLGLFWVLPEIRLGGFLL